MGEIKDFPGKEIGKNISEASLKLLPETRKTPFLLGKHSFSSPK